MTPQQAQLVRDSFKLVEPIADQAAALFYDNLFNADPALRAKFRGDMQRQGQLLMTMIGSAVKLLDKPDALLPVLRSLGARHLSYGVQDSHYPTVGGALLLTLEQGLGNAFTPPVRDAWVALYSVVCSTMLEGAREAIPA